MWRFVLAAVVATVGGSSFGQEKKPNPESAKEKEAWMKHAEAYLKKHPTEVPELLALAEKSDQTLTDLLAAVKVSDDDKPAVRAAKRAMLAEDERRKLIRARMQAGTFPDSVRFLQLSDTAVGVYNAAALIWTDPEKLLPFAECVAAELLKAELFNTWQVERRNEGPQLLPQLHAARYQAEVVVLKLREQAKKK